MISSAITWKNLNKKIKNKNVIFYGFGQDWIRKSLNQIKNKPKYILDNNIAYRNKIYENIEILTYKEFKKLKLKNVIFVITASLIEEISHSLILENYKAGKDFFVTPELRDFIYLQNIRKKNLKVLISSSDYRYSFKDKNTVRKSRGGGGLFLMDTRKKSLKKLYSGQIRQFKFFKNKYYLIEYYKKQLIILNKNFKKIKIIELDQTKKREVPPNFCGLAISEKKKLIYVANSANDKIYIYSLKNFEFIDIIDFRKINRIDKKISKFHINDLFLFKENLYVSFFSISGNYNNKKFVQDGGVISINLKNYKVTRCMKNLQKPHSPVIHEGKLFVLDSSSGKLLDNNMNVLGEFNGFIRGLDFSEKFFIISQSEDMYSSLNFNKARRGPTSCNSGIIIFDQENNLVRFYPTTSIMNIHHIKVLDV